MKRDGNVEAGSPLTKDSWMVRETLGFAWGVERNLRLKTSVEYYEFSGADPAGDKQDLAIHVGAAGTF